MSNPVSTAPSSPEANIPVTRGERVGWYFYDWANSAFSTTVVTVFLGPYLTTIAEAAADANNYVYPLGIPVLADSFFPYMVSLSVLLQVLFLPILGAIADYSNLKKHFLGVFAYIGAFATMGMYFLEGERYLLGGILFLIANLSFGASIVFYNSLLVDIAPPDERDKVSSRGWATGYLGGGLLLFVHLMLFSNAESFGLTSEHAVRISMASAGMWWAIFTLIPLKKLRRRRPVKDLPQGERYVTIGFKQLGHTIRSLPKYPQTLFFLVAYLIYNDGIQTVIALSSQFGSEELGMTLGELTQMVLMIQFVAFIGALFFGFVSSRLGTKRTIMVTLLIWSLVVIYAYQWLETKTQFFVMGAVVALVLGGSQALSRSLFSLMIPRGQEAEYFSLYEVSERGTSWLGPLVFGMSLQMTNSYRIAILSLVIFFVLGLVLLTFANVRRAIAEAGNEVPSRV